MTSSACLAGGVHAVRDHHHRAPTLAVAGQVARRVLQRVVQRRGPVRLDLVHGLQDPLPVGGEADDSPVLVVEGGQRRLVLGLERGQDLDRGHARAGGLELAVHAAARVHEQEDARAGVPGGREMLQLLRLAVLEDPQLRGLEVLDGPPVGIHGGGGEGHEVCAGGEAGHLSRATAAERPRARTRATVRSRAGTGACAHRHPQTKPV